MKLKAAGLNNESGQEVAKIKPRFAKTDIRYWQEAIFHSEYKWQGETRHTSEWVARMQHLKRRGLFPLQTANKAAAASRAKDIYLFLQSNGWEATIEKFKPASKNQTEEVCTVGQFLTEIAAKASARPKTVADYCRAFRTIVASIFGIDDGRAKFDHCNGGRDRWLAKIEAIRLADVSPDKVQSWKIAFLRRAGSDPVKQRAARISYNSLLRQAKSLFAPNMLRFIKIETPEKLPFDGVSFEPRQSMRYHGGFDVEQLIRDAGVELNCGNTVEQFKIFVLAVFAGLRRNEIDKLEWDAFRWEEKAIRIEATKFFRPKSEDSVGDVALDPEVHAALLGFMITAKSNFVIESPVSPRPGAAYSHYRCSRHFTQLAAWLRSKGVGGNTPLHTLRKEYGSQICAKHGIYAASHALRHADISITSQHYLDQKSRVTVGMGHLLGPKIVS